MASSDQCMLHPETPVTIASEAGFGQGSMPSAASAMEASRPPSGSQPAAPCTADV